VVCYHFLALHFAHWLKETEQSCVLHAFREKENNWNCVCCVSPLTSLLLQPCATGIKLNAEISTVMNNYEGVEQAETSKVVTGST
jgi:hypothetical protein